MKTDARVRYTRMIIKNTFLELLKEKPISKITVKEICTLAEINRTTFYKYYMDAYDLLEQLEEEGISELLSLFDAEEEQEKGQILISILRTLYENRSQFQKFVKTDDEKGFTYRLAIKCYQKMYELEKTGSSTAPFESTSALHFSYVAGGVSGIIEYWLKSGMKESPETIADTIDKFNRSVLESL